MKHVHYALRLRTTTYTNATAARLFFPSAYQSRLPTHPIVNSLWVTWSTGFVVFFFQYHLASWISCIGTCWHRIRHNISWEVIFGASWMKTSALLTSSVSSHMTLFNLPLIIACTYFEHLFISVIVSAKLSLKHCWMKEEFLETAQKPI